MLLLFLNIFLNCGFIKSYRTYIINLLPKNVCSLNLYFKLACLSNIINALLPFKYPMKCFQHLFVVEYLPTYGHDLALSGLPHYFQHLYIGIVYENISQTTPILIMDYFSSILRCKYNGTYTSILYVTNL